MIDQLTTFMLLIFIDKLRKLVFLLGVALPGFDAKTKNQIRFVLFTVSMLSLVFPFCSIKFHPLIYRHPFMWLNFGQSTI